MLEKLCKEKEKNVWVSGLSASSVNVISTGGKRFILNFLKSVSRRRLCRGLSEYT